MLEKLAAKLNAYLPWVPARNRQHPIGVGLPTTGLVVLVSLDPPVAKDSRYIRL